MNTLPTPSVPTPGVSAAAVRSPTQPTLPDADPASLTLAISHVVNELWGAPPALTPTTVGSVMGTPAGVPSSTGAPAGVPSSTGAPVGVPSSPRAPVPDSPAFAPSLGALPQGAPDASSSQAYAPSLGALPSGTTGSAPAHGSSSTAQPMTTAAAPAATVPGMGTAHVPHAGTSPTAQPAGAIELQRDEQRRESAHPFFVEPQFSDALLGAPGAQHDDTSGLSPFHMPLSLPLHESFRESSVQDSSSMRDHTTAPRGTPDAPFAPPHDVTHAPARGDASRVEDGARSTTTSAPGAPASGARVDPPRHPFGDLSSSFEPSVGLSRPTHSSGFDAHALKREFPILEERVHGRRLVWLDNAATTQKPRTVIDRLTYFYEHENSNIHRAAHALAARATDAYESARESVRRFVNAASSSEIVFVRGATEGINLIAQSYGRRNVRAGDEIVVTHLEHHANIVPWQQLCSETGARLRVAPVDDDGQIILEAYERLLSDKTRIVSLTQVSNALGTITPAREMTEMAHRFGATVVLDGAQAVSHMRVDVQTLDCDFLVFSGHKIFAPTGIGAVFGKRAFLDAMPPWQGGGNMIHDVTFERTVYQPAPMRFEAGTGNIADAVGLGAALDWLTRVGIENVARHEHELLVDATERMRRVPGLTIIGTAREKAGVISFTLDGHSTHDVSTALDRHGIAVRGGHHCAQPILRRFGLESTVRASFAPYNTHEDIDALVAALCEIQGTR